MKTLTEAIEKMFKEATNEPITKHDYQIKNCISYWFPILKKSGVFVPETIIINTGTGLYDFYNMMDNKTDDIISKFNKLVKDIKSASDIVGVPFFLRTGVLSGKHDWKDTCYVQSRETSVIEDHVMNLINTSGMAFPGQCTDVWAVRKIIETVPAFYAFDGDMPITKERRFFIDNRKIIGDISYWPEEAFVNQKTSISNWKEKIEKLSKMSGGDLCETTRIVSHLTNYFDGAWSIDLLMSKDNGWIVTDMALANMSWGYNLIKKNKTEGNICLI